MSSGNFHTPFNDTLKKVKAYNLRLPLRISQNALLEMKTNFEREGYDDDFGFKKWAPRKKTKGKLKRALLVQSSRLKRSLKAAPLQNEARVITDVPYAGPLHKGFKGNVSVRPHKRNASRTVTIRGGFSGLGKKTRAKKGKMLGSRHNVRGHNRKVNLQARPFLTVGPAFLNKQEVKVLDELENIFLQS
jgi:phage gpG-like protein